MDIGNKIQTIRTTHEMTQAEFAEKFNVTRQTVSNWENNKNYPDMDTLCRISDEFNVSLDILLKEDQTFISRIDRTADRAVRATRVLLILVPLVIILLVAGIVVATHHHKAESQESSILPGLDDKNYEYAVNENGQTYGPDWMGADYEEHAPDLIAASGINGRKGYVKRIDLESQEGDLVNSPEEAVEYMDRVKQRNGQNYYIVIPVFKEDGVTEIDQFWIYNGSENQGKNSDEQAVTVPDVTGMTLEQAKKVIEEAGLSVGGVSYETSAQEEGVVLMQNPPPGDSTPDSQIDLIIGEKQ